MCSRTGYKSQILHTDSLGYSKYHVIRPPKMVRPEYYFMRYSNMAAIKNRCSSPICHILKINEYLLNLRKRVYHTYSGVNIKCHFKISRSMSRSILHIEHENLIITFCICTLGLKREHSIFRYFCSYQDISVELRNEVMYDQ